MIGPAPGRGADHRDAARGARLGRDLGRLSRSSSRSAPAAACSSIRAPAMASRRPSRCRARSTTCSARRSTCCRSCSTRSASGAASCSGTATAPRSRRIYAGSVQDHRVRGLVLMAPHFFVEAARPRRDREDRARLRDERPARPARAPPRRCRCRLPRLERCLARSAVSRAFDITEALAYIRVPVLASRAKPTRTAR